MFNQSLITVTGGTLSHAPTVYNTASLTIAGGVFTNVNANNPDIYDYANLTLTDNQTSGTYLVLSTAALP